MSYHPSDLNHNVILKVELCASWPLEKEKDNITNYIVRVLEKKGLDVKCEFISLLGGNNELIIYMIKHDGSKKIIFSNNKLHELNGSIFGITINEDIAKELVKRILKERE